MAASAKFKVVQALVSRWCKTVEVDGDMQKSEV